MASKDPFNELPPIQDEPVRPAEPHAPASRPQVHEDVTKGTAPRNLLTSISKFAIPLAGAGLLVWIMMPTEQGGRKAAAPEATVDQAKQVSQTNALIDGLKESASKAPRTQVQEAPGVPTAAAPVAPTAPLPIEAANPDLERLRVDAERRAQEIRSSPLEAGSFKLASDDGSSAAPARPRTFDVQAEIAANNAARQDAMRSQERLLERAMSAHAGPAEPPKEKESNVAFLEQQASASKQSDVVRQQPSAARYLVNQGTVIRAVLLTGVNSDLPGTVKAQVTSDVYDSTFGRHVLIPKGSTMIGAYNSEVKVGQERLMMAMTRMIFPNGTWASLAGAGASDGIGQAGVGADVNNHFWKIFGTSLVLGAASTFLPDREKSLSTTNTAGGVTQGGTVFGMALNETLRAILERNKNIGPTLSLRPGEEFTLLVAKDMVLQPYR